MDDSTTSLTKCQFQQPLDITTYLLNHILLEPLTRTTTRKPIYQLALSVALSPSSIRSASATSQLPTHLIPYMRAYRCLSTYRQVGQERFTVRSKLATSGDSQTPRLMEFSYSNLSQESDQK